EPQVVRFQKPGRRTAVETEQPFQSGGEAPLELSLPFFENHPPPRAVELGGQPLEARRSRNGGMREPLTQAGEADRELRRSPGGELRGEGGDLPLQLPRVREVVAEPARHPA